MSEPICHISLPTHHPAVSGLKKGQAVHIVATRQEEPEPPLMPAEKGAKQPVRPPMLQTPFHVMEIAPGKVPNVRSANGKPQSPVEYLKSRRGAADSTGASGM